MKKTKKKLAEIKRGEKRRLRLKKSKEKTALKKQLDLKQKKYLIEKENEEVNKIIRSRNVSTLN